MSRLVILDRDGVLNRDLPQGVLARTDLMILPGAPEAVARLNRAGYLVAVASNQSAVGKGLLGLGELEAINVDLEAALARAGGHLDALVVCTDAPEAPTRRRKPGPGMIEEILHRFEAAPAETPVIGDALRDLQAAAAVGCPRMLVRTGKGRATEMSGLPAEVLPVTVHDDLAAAVEALLAAER